MSGARPEDTSVVVGFDLDLTLVDSADGITASFLEATRQVGVAVDPAELRPLIGLPLPDTMAHFVPPESIPRAIEIYREVYPNLGVPASKPLPGAFEAVDAVTRRGGRAIVISAKIASAVRQVLEHVGIEVADVVGERFAETKGDALRQYGAAAHVGDHPGDMIGARSAGACAVGVTTGGHDAVALREAGADVVFADLLDFPYWLDDFIAAQ
ncbi:HAD family hydrolase [Phytoactinopolyspora halotolerans]|uniref:HAD family hydrolase n=1 Tax=Phytoactinopolyspora halotolerans TaxID=1981512 RepID=A0A6L9S1V6_9ACTN|nr:HAD family hydrolase [Phytoactinopolyspora halotolerans]NED98968.1 HAD family hydrolase [Phytoactinopolyspora halotolerans]